MGTPAPYPMRNGWTEEAFSRFWHRMGEIFGKSWYEHNGPEMNATWRASVIGLQMENVARGIEHYRTSGDAFGPNLSQFLSVCKQFRGGQQQYVALPKPQISQEKIEENLSRIKLAAKTGGRRSVLLPGESFRDYQIALHVAKENGMKKDDFDRGRLAQNGWTDADESALRASASACGVRSR